MILDYNDLNHSFILRVGRGGTDINSLMTDYGLDFSQTASSPGEAILFTKNHYCAASFGAFATPNARRQISGILEEIDASFAAESSAHIRCPADKELWGFQKADIEYALRRRHTLVGDQPGLGKTPIAICYANEIKARRVLVVCPASIRWQWVRRIKEWSTMRDPLIHAVLKGKYGINPDAEWIVISYELTRDAGIQAALMKGTYDLLILDEAHYLKTSGSQRTRATFGSHAHGAAPPLSGRCGAIMALTGTPLPNRPREAYTLARALNWDAIDWMSEDDFGRRFNPSIRVEHVDPVTGSRSFHIDERTGRHSELQNRLRANFMTRHLKRDVMPQLKLPIYDLIQVEKTGAVKQALEAESLLDIDPDDLSGANATVLGHIAEARRIMGEALAPQVADYVEMLIDGGEEKIVLFAWHISVMDTLERRLAKHGVVRVDGRTSPGAKEKAVAAFQTNPGVRIILGNVLSLGTGTDGLQHASNHALIAEPSWTPGENIQCFDRLDRGGQTRAVQGDIFVAPNSIAERILASALRKLQTTHKALDKRIGT